MVEVEGMCYIKNTRIVVCKKAMNEGGICKKIISKVQIGKTYTLWHGGKRLDAYYYTVSEIGENYIEATATLIHPIAATKNNICNASMPVTFHLV